MYARLTYCKFIPDRIPEARKRFLDQVVPTVKAQKGNLGIRLLEPQDKTDDFISITEWDTKEHADAYQQSGVYRELLHLLGDYFVKAPVLKTYQVEEVHIYTGTH